jgi:signal transduction histidine kinase
MASQDEERRRIARELHDSTAQQLTGIRMNLGTIKRALTNADPKTLRAVKECQQLAEQCAREIRTLSYLLHPPLLEEFGLAMALQSYIEGLGKRSELEIHLDVDGALAELRFSRELETSLFRIVQESLNNIIRHSGSATAAVRLKHSDGEIRLQISDHGTASIPRLSWRLAAETAPLWESAFQVCASEFGNSVATSISNPALLEPLSSWTCR